MDFIYHQVTVTDEDGLSASTETTITISPPPEPANTPPTVSIDATQVTTAEAGEAVALQGVGGDAETAAEFLTFAWSQVGGTPAVSIAGASTATSSFTAPDVTGETELTFRLTVTDEDGLSASAETTVTISPSPEPANTPPTFDEGDRAERSLAENSEAGENVGAPLTATDPDGESLTYTLSGDDADSFDIDADTDQLLTKEGVTYDDETKSSYSVRAEASDGNGGTASIDVTVSLTDVDEATPVTTCFTDLNELTSAAKFTGAWDDSGAAPTTGRTARPGSSTSPYRRRPRSPSPSRRSRAGRCSCRRARRRMGGERRPTAPMRFAGRSAATTAS